jgi:hypothetical protein
MYFVLCRPFSPQPTRMVLPFEQLTNLLFGTSYSSFIYFLWKYFLVILYSKLSFLSSLTLSRLSCLHLILIILPFLFCFHKKNIRSLPNSFLFFISPHWIRKLSLVFNICLHFYIFFFALTFFSTYSFNSYSHPFSLSND